jgi:hypothetical protein
MKSGRPTRATTACVAVSLALTPGLVAQVVGVVDVGVADVRYDGFLPSSAASISPTFGLELPWALVSVRGTYLHFESGRHSLQGNLAASLFTRPTGRLRGEFSGSLGASRYAAFASFSHVLFGPRVHLAGERQGAWLSGTAGSSTFGQVPRPATVFSVGTWAERLAATWRVSTTVTHVGDTVYADIEGATHGQRGGSIRWSARGARLEPGRRTRCLRRSERGFRRQCLARRGRQRWAVSDGSHARQRFRALSRRDTPHDRCATADYARAIHATPRAALALSGKRE